MSSLAATIIILAAMGPETGAAKAGGSFVNSVGMELVPIPGGEFLMGYSHTPMPKNLTLHLPLGDADERPYHNVTITPFLLAATEVTNAQYERYDPSHRALRGKAHFSTGDHEAVVFVSHTDALGYAVWLSKQESVPYRLPTEAEWEFAARGNGETVYDYFWTGEGVPEGMQKDQSQRGIPTFAVNLTVGQSVPNGYGVHDTLGNVEEWVADWHGPYSEEHAVDPKGPATGIFRVTRGGSHSTSLYYLRTANRAGALPEDRSWYVGFRLAADHPSAAARKVASPSAEVPVGSEEREGEEDATGPASSSVEVEEKGARPSQVPAAVAGGIVVRDYVKIPGDGLTALPFSKHNHEPTIAACPNGDLLAAWYSCYREPGREVGLVFSRLRPGDDAWPPAAVLFDAPDRCDCCIALHVDPTSGLLYQFSAVSAAGTYEDIVGVVRSSGDCGLTWSAPTIVWPEHGIAHQVVVSIVQTRSGEVLVPCDHWGELPFTYRGDQSVVQRAPVGELMRPASWRVNATAQTGSHHTSLVELRNGTILAFGRGHDIAGTMAMSYSNDDGNTWTAHKSAFPGIHSGQRGVLLRAGPIDTAPLVGCSFANKAMAVPNSAGGSNMVMGLYCAVSDDEGESWERRRVLTDDDTSAGHKLPGMDGMKFRMSLTSSEPRGYLAAAYSPPSGTGGEGGGGGLVHAISSRQHYQFPLAWLRAPAPPAPPPTPPAQGRR